MTATVSVIIPVYNNSGTVLRAVESALAQEGVLPEVIVIDDGSTDGSTDVLTSVLDRVKVLKQTNAGPGSARNRGLAEASGEYIAFLDADDYWLGGFLSRTTRFLEENPACGAVSTAYYRFFGRTLSLWPPGCDTGSLPTGVIDDFFSTYTRFRQAWTGTVVLRRSVVDTVGRMRTDLPTAQDTEYWLRAATVTSWGFIAEPFAVYDRSSGTSLTAVKFRKRLAPRIEDWQSSILPLLQPGQLESFRAYRSDYARRRISRLIALGELEQARDVSRSGFVIPNGRHGLLSSWLGSAPAFVWHIAFLLVRIRSKARRIVRTLAGITPWSKPVSPSPLPPPAQWTATRAP